MKGKMLNRRDMLKMGGIFALGTPFLKPKIRPYKNNLTGFFEKNKHYRRPEKPITAIVLGAGNRGNLYASYSEKFPDELKIVGVAEPIDYRRKRFSEKYIFLKNINL